MLISVAVELEGRETEIACVAGLAQPHIRKKIQRHMGSSPMSIQTLSVCPRHAFLLLSLMPDRLAFGISSTCDDVLVKI